MPVKRAFRLSDLACSDSLDKGCNYMLGKHASLLRTSHTFEIVVDHGDELWWGMITAVRLNRVRRRPPTSKFKPNELHPGLELSPCKKAATYNHFYVELCSQTLDSLPIPFSLSQSHVLVLSSLDYPLITFNQISLGTKFLQPSLDASFEDVRL